MHTRARAQARDASLLGDQDRQLVALGAALVGLVPAQVHVLGAGPSPFGVRDLAVADITQPLESLLRLVAAGDGAELGELPRDPRVMVSEQLAQAQRLVGSLGVEVARL